VIPCSLFIFTLMMAFYNTLFYIFSLLCCIPVLLVSRCRFQNLRSKWHSVEKAWLALMKQQHALDDAFLLDTND
jgi:phosphatidylserine synthase